MLSLRIRLEIEGKLSFSWENNLFIYFLPRVQVYCGMEPAVCVHRLNLSTVLGILKIKIVSLDFLRQFESSQLKYSYEYALDWISEVLLRK